jgi:hypothetical protein
MHIRTPRAPKQGVECRDPRPLKNVGQDPRCGKHGDEQGHRDDERRRRLGARHEVRRKDHEIAGDTSGITKLGG